ncbi:hypothetical protein KKH82_02025 [Patescibacteria group bacterium]|nr:hypothetical protein [Patescibacteria group bacterium]
MIKKITLLAIMTAFLGISFANFEVPGNSTIYTEDANQVLEANEISNPIRDGAFKVINAEDSSHPEEAVGGLVSVGTQIENHETAKLQTLDIVRNIINYALGLVSLVALIYLIYHGIMVLTAT